MKAPLRTFLAAATATILAVAFAGPAVATPNVPALDASTSDGRAPIVRTEDGVVRGTTVRGIGAGAVEL